MYSKEQAKSEISALVNHFEKNIDIYKKPSYKEAQCENDFIRPLFSFLNWNTTNSGLEPEKQVFQLQVTGKTGDDSSKRPDYLLKVPVQNSNQMKSVFFIEAKKPSYELKTNAKYLRQVYQYAYSTLSASNSPNERVRLALLTDFEEFRFFDCLDPNPLNKKYENKYEAFNKHIIKDWTYKDYVNRFDEFWDLFEYNNVVNGSLDNWYLTEKQITENRLTPDRKFLDDLKSWRLDVARSMYKNDKSLDDFQLTKATLLFINRIIFIKMLADRNIEADYLTNILSNISKSKKEDVKLYELCQDIFKRLDHIYNGSIFAYDADCDEVEISNNVLKNIFEELKPENSIYTLAAMPVEIIGYVYEQFIAEQIVKKGTGIALVPKYDEKKAKGVYYTPRYIVEYIVDNTLGKKLEECKSLEDAEKIKILDPACGSGSFLIVAYQRLLEWHKKFIFNAYHDNIKNPNEKNAKKLSSLRKRLKELGHPDSYETSTDYHNISLTHKMKSTILKSCIFGVDIDQQAVMVTKFSLSIKALEDSSHDEIVNDYEIFKMPLLPNLDDNIKCGNSLIASDFYFDNKPSLFNEKEKREINTFDWDSKSGFPDIMKSGGFDVIIGNPPWGQKDMMFTKENLDYLKERYKISSIGIIDLFRFFIEKSINLTIKDGLWGQVLPDVVLLKNYDSTRKYILENIKLNKIDHWGMAFSGVNLDVCSLTGIRRNKSINNKIYIRIKDKDNYITNEVTQLDYLNNIGFKFNLFFEEKQQILLNKLLTNYKFGDFFEPHEGIHSGNIRAKLFMDMKINNNCKKLIFGRDEVIRYYLSWNGQWVNYNKNIVIKKLGEYAGLGRKEYFDNNKIVVRRTGDYILANVDYNGYYFSNNAFVCPLKENHDINLSFTLGILNSKLSTWYYRNVQPRKGKLFAELKINVLKTIPIPKVDFTNKTEKQLHDKLVYLVEQMLENQKYMHESKTNSDKEMYRKICDHLDSEIDKIVYKLYGLTDEEIKIVEGK